MSNQEYLSWGFVAGFFAAILLRFAHAIVERRHVDSLRFRERELHDNFDRLIAESDRRSRELAELKGSPWVRLLGLVRGRRYELSLRLMPPLGRWVCTVTLWDKDDWENVFQGVAEDGTPEHAVAEAAGAVEEHLAELAPPAGDVTEGEAD